MQLNQTLWREQNSPPTFPCKVFLRSETCETPNILCCHIHLPQWEAGSHWLRGRPIGCRLSFLGGRPFKWCGWVFMRASFAWRPLSHTQPAIVTVSQEDFKGSQGPGPVGETCEWQEDRRRGQWEEPRVWDDRGEGSRWRQSFWGGRIKRKWQTDRVYKKKKISVEEREKERDKEGAGQEQTSQDTTTFFSSSEHGGRVHMDLVDLYLPECFTYHSDTE